MYFQENVENNVCDLRFRPELSVILKKKLWIPISKQDT